PLDPAPMAQRDAIATRQLIADDLGIDLESLAQAQQDQSPMASFEQSHRAGRGGCAAPLTINRRKVLPRDTAFPIGLAARNPTIDQVRSQRFHDGMVSQP